MLFLTKKRGQIVFKPISEIVIGIAIFFLFVYVGKSYGTGEIFEKITISEDTALSTNLLSSFPDDAFLVSTSDTSKFLINIQDAKITTTSIKEDPTQAIRYFIKGKTTTLDSSLEKPSTLITSRSGSTILISNTETISEKQRCPSIETIKHAKIIITPKTKEEIIYDFTNSLSAFIQNSEVKDPLEIQEKAELIIEITETQEKNKATIYIAQNLESKRLACLIINNLIELNPELTTLIIPSDNPLFQNSEIAISLEISKELETQSTLTAIKKAFEDY